MSDLPRPEHSDARILIVDDERANVALLERLLARGGYVNLRSITDSAMVLDTVRDWLPDVVMLDLMMPPPDGFAILGAIVSRPAAERIPVLVLTASSTRDVKERALASGAADFLTKPFDHVEVLLRTRNLLSARALELELRNQNEMLEMRVGQRTSALTHSLTELERSMAERRSLVSSLVTAQEEERRRIASDIHDDTLQTLIAVSMKVERMRREPADSSTRADLEAILDGTREAIGRLRTLLFDVHPAALERDGLASAIEAYLERIRASGGPDFGIHADLAHDPAPETRATLYRIAQEALTNMRKHARATRVDVTLRGDGDGFWMRISDDGTGFDVEQADGRNDGHLGLTTMRERASVADGVLHIESAPGRGTVIEVRLPADARTGGPTGSRIPTEAPMQGSRVA